VKFRLKSGLGIHYTTRGAGRSVVLMHPIGVTGEIWDDVVAELEDEYRLIVPDFRGHGDSDVPATPFKLPDLVADVVELVRAVGQPPAVFVGCSMGGMVAQGIAVEAPEIAAGIVIANTAHLRNDQGRAAMEQRAVAAEKGMPPTLPTTLARWFDARTQLARPDLVTLAKAWLSEADPVVHAWAWRAIRDLDYGDRLVKADIPALAIGGTRDQSTSAATVREMAAAMRRCAFSEIDSGHLSPLEEPAEFAAVLRDFLTSL
jgi:3-oxoadipate enol-lactonase